jgi:hypothetical protein
MEARRQNAIYLYISTADLVSYKLWYSDTCLQTQQDYLGVIQLVWKEKSDVNLANVQIGLVHNSGSICKINS